MRTAPQPLSSMTGTTVSAHRAAAPAAADWRITRFFIGKAHRGKGVASVALIGARDGIPRLGGGLVEALPEDTAGRKVAFSFLINGALATFQAMGFARTRQIGKHKWLSSRAVAAFP